MEQVTYAITDKGSRHLEKLRDKFLSKVGLPSLTAPLDYLTGEPVKVHKPLFADVPMFVLECVERRSMTGGEIVSRLEPRLARYGGLGSKWRQRDILQELGRLVRAGYIIEEAVP